MWENCWREQDHVKDGGDLGRVVAVGPLAASSMAKLLKV